MSSERFSATNERATHAQQNKNQMSKPRLRFEYWKSTKNNQWYWRLKAGNGEPVCQSEGYKRKEAVMKVYRLLFEGESKPEAVDINAESFAKFKKAVGLSEKKPKNYQGHINRNWP